MGKLHIKKIHMGEMAGKNFKFTQNLHTQKCYNHFHINHLQNYYCSRNIQKHIFGKNNYYNIS